MRVLLLNQPFWPDTVATAQHAWDLALHLARSGHQVHVVASRAVYGERGATLARHEVVDGVAIHRVGTSLFGKRGLVLRAIDAMLFLPLVAFRALTLPRPDVVVSLTNPPFMALVARLVAAWRGVPWVYWLMDLYPDVAITCGFLDERSLLARTLEALHRTTLRAADVLVPLGRCMADRVAAKGVARDRMRVIGPWSDSEEVPDRAPRESPYRAEWGLGDRFVVMYSGNFGLGHDVRTPCEAAALLRDRDDVAFAFAGAGKRKAELEECLRERALPNARTFPHQPRERLGDLLSAADAHLITMRPEALGTMVPSKLFGAMAAGRACLVVGPRESEVARIVEEERCGLVIEPGDAAGLAGAVARLAGDRAECAAMGSRARAALRARHERLVSCAAWEALLSEVAGRRPSETR